MVLVVGVVPVRPEQLRPNRLVQVLEVVMVELEYKMIIVQVLTSIMVVAVAVVLG